MVVGVTEGTVMLAVGDGLSVGLTLAEGGKLAEDVKLGLVVGVGDCTDTLTVFDCDTWLVVADGDPLTLGVINDGVEGLTDTVGVMDGLGVTARGTGDALITGSGVSINTGPNPYAQLT